MLSLPHISSMGLQRLQFGLVLTSLASSGVVVKSSRSRELFSHLLTLFLKWCFNSLPAPSSDQVARLAGF